MSPLQAQLHTAPVAADSLPGSKQKRLAPPKGGAADWLCLVLSADRSRRERLHLAAEAAGWSPLACATAREATEQDEKWRTQFAMIDLASVIERNRGTFREFAQRLPGRSNPLLMVCDDCPTSEGETWARQLGAWLYLPEPELGEELVGLCVEAMQIAQKRVASLQTATTA